MQLLVTGKQRAGKTSRVMTQGAALTYASWKADLKGADLETVNFESYNAVALQTYGEGILGVLDADTSFGGDWDAGTNPLDNPPGLYPRDDLPTTLFYTSRIDVVFWSFPYMRLRSTSCGSEVKGKVTFSTSGHNQGPFTFPTGSV